MIEPSIFNEIIGFALGKAYPLKQIVYYTDAELYILKKKYGKWKWITVVLMILFLTGLVLFYAYVLHYVYLWLYSITLSKSTVFYEVGFGYQFLPSIPLAMASLDIPLTFVQKLFIRDYNEFESYFNYMKWKEKGFDNKSASIQFPRVFVLISLIPMSMAFTSKLEVTEHQLIFKRFFDFNETSYPISEVHRIINYKETFYDNGKIDTTQQSWIFFKDGTQFKTKDFVTDPDGEISFTKLLSQKSKCKIEDGGVISD